MAKLLDDTHRSRLEDGLGVVRSVRHLHKAVIVNEKMRPLSDISQCDALVLGPSLG